jgi:hypothetical protein
VPRLARLGRRWQGGGQAPEHRRGLTRGRALGGVFGQQPVEYVPQRVVHGNPFAAQHTYSAYEALPDSVYNFTKKHLPGMHDSIHVWANEKWINYQMMQGKAIVDVGSPDPALNPRGLGALPPGEFYDMELQQVAGYPAYRQDIQPPGTSDPWRFIMTENEPSYFEYATAQVSGPCGGPGVSRELFFV